MDLCIHKDILLKQFDLDRNCLKVVCAEIGARHRKRGINCIEDMENCT
jgi:hypothetical protein